jgi:hypothetical protein
VSSVFDSLLRTRIFGSTGPFNFLNPFNKPKALDSCDVSAVFLHDRVSLLPNPSPERKLTSQNEGC